MKYCPNCKRDFEDTATLCRWCELELVDELPDEKSINEEKLRRELLPTEEEINEQEVNFFDENAETVTVYTDFDPLQIRDIEAALKEKGIPVLVRPAKPDVTELPEEEPVEAEEAEESEKVTEESAEEAAETAEEQAEETGTAKEVDAEPEKKGFFARLFGKKKKEKKTEEYVEEYRFTRGGMLLDVVVPASLAEEAVNEVNTLLGISGATDDWHYEDAETVSEILKEAEEADYDEIDHEPDELTHLVEEDFADEY